MSAAIDLLRQLDGQEIPGGCEDCHAVQIVDASQAPIWGIRIYHDDTCPAYLARVRSQE